MKKIVLMLMAMVVFGNVLGQPLGTDFYPALNISETVGAEAIGKVRMIGANATTNGSYTVVTINADGDVNSTQQPKIETNGTSFGLKQYTKTYGFFAFDNDDKHILALLMNAKNNNLNIRVGISDDGVDLNRINKILWVQIF